MEFNLPKLHNPKSKPNAFFKQKENIFILHILFSAIASSSETDLSSTTHPTALAPFQHLSSSCVCVYVWLEENLIWKILTDLLTCLYHFVPFGTGRTPSLSFILISGCLNGMVVSHHFYYTYPSRFDCAFCTSGHLRHTICLMDQVPSKVAFLHCDMLFNSLPLPLAPMPHQLSLLFFL